MTDYVVQRNTQLENLTLLEKLGMGGQGEVWSAYDQENDQVVAVKLLSQPEETLSDVSQELDKEFYLLASLSHPHILPLFDLSLTAEWHYYTMHYCAGGSVRGWLSKAHTSWGEITKLGAQVASALAYIHDFQIVHRDLKPSNILLDMQGGVYLVDFGLATTINRAETDIIHTGRGTVPYAPPEQHTGQVVTLQSDIFSLGVVLYEMITGRLPISHDYSLGHQQALDSNVQLTMPGHSRLPMPGPVLDALRKLTAADPDARPESAVDAFAEVLAALSAAGEIDDLDQRLEELEPILYASNTQSLPVKALQQADARALLAKHMGDGQQTITLTDYALLNAGLEVEQCTKDEKAFMFDVAFVHNYRIDFWRFVNSDNDAARFKTYSRLLNAPAENGTTARAVVEQLAAEDQPTLRAHMLAPEAYGKLIEWATKEARTLMGSTALDILERTVDPEKASWQQETYPEEAAAMLANYALSDKPHAGRLARLIGQAKSPQALKTIIRRADGDTLDSPVWPVLRTIKQEAGTLPDSVPNWVRRMMVFNRVLSLFQQRTQTLHIWQRALIGGLTGALIALLMMAGIFNYANNRLQDFVYAPYEASGLISIVGIDDETLDAYGRWGDWPRSRHADLLAQLEEMGARVVVLDVLFASETDDDPTLSSAVSESAAVVLASAGQGTPRFGERLLHYERQISPTASLMQAAASVGHTNIIFDSDGVVREVPLFISSDEAGDQQSIALAALSTYLGTELPPYDPELNAISFGAREVPVHRHATMTINYAGPPGEGFPVTSYKDVLEGNVPPGTFENKLVLVGMMATAEPDSYPTPLSRGEPMFGVEILANSIETIWAQRFVSEPTQPARIALLTGIAMVTAFLPGRPWVGMASMVALSLGYVLVTFIAFDTLGILLDVFYPLLAIWLTYTVITVYRYRQERRRRDEVTALFEAQVTPEIAAATLEAFDAGSLNLSGQVQEVTVLFADIRGYTAFSETHAPDEVMDMVNTILGTVGDTILKHDGTIVNYEGDKVMAVFNAPIPQPGHANMALATAEDIITDLRRYQAKLPEDHPYQHIALGYGIMSGLAVVGYMGARERYEYSALGDAVNIASRLSDEADAGQILIGQATVNRMSASDRVTPLSTITLKGRSAPLTIYTLTQGVTDDS
jgi:adenylate cyclase